MSQFATKAPRIMLPLVLSALVSSCAITDYEFVQSENHNDRVRFLVLHHTVIDFERSMRALTKSPGVSAHYLIPERNDPSYPDDELKIFQLVDEKDRAWHAGNSYWQGVRSLNDQSIGIELVYQSSCPLDKNITLYDATLNIDASTDRLCFYPDYDDKQIELLIELVQEILERNPEITPTRIVGHSDITPSRRVDPGPRFPWHRLYQAGIGAWYDENTVQHYWQQFRSGLPSVGLIQKALRTYGYGLTETGIMDSETVNTLNVFQMHFRPWQVTGKVTPETAATLFALIEKYFPKKLDALIKQYQSEQLPIVSPIAPIAGQIEQSFPTKDPSTRQLVNNRDTFIAFNKKLDLKVVTNDATSADIIVNGKNIAKDVKFSSTEPTIITLQYSLKKGLNQVKVENIVPADANLSLYLPYPTFTKPTTKMQWHYAKAFEKVDELIQQDVNNGFPGAVLMVVKDGEILKHTAYGYANKYSADGQPLDTPEKMQKDTMFDLASNTKMYATNFALMKLVSEGKLDVNKPINYYVPEYTSGGRDSRLVVDLLNHSAGYAPTVNFHDKANPLGESFFSHNKEKTTQLLFTKVPFATSQRIKQVYSDTDYMLLGAIIERITRQPLDVYVENTIYNPMGLKNTLFKPLDKHVPIKHIAATEIFGNTRQNTVEFDNIRTQVIRGEVHDEKAFHAMQGVAGHAGLFSTAEDVSKLASVILNRGGYGDTRVFSNDAIDNFIRPSYGDITYGLGWRRSGNGDMKWSFGPYASQYAVGHTGWTGTLTVIDPYYNLSIVLLTNKKHSNIVNIDGKPTFQGDTFETGKYGSIVSLVYEALFANK